jgi:hypothetical protein
MPMVMDMCFREEERASGLVSVQTNSTHDMIFFYLTLPGDMKSLHDLILQEERRLLCIESSTYLLFVVKVPIGLYFIDKHPANVFFL